MPGTKPRGQHRDKRLSAAFVRTVKEPGFYADGHGLHLKVDASGAKRWVQRIVVNGKRQDIGVGSASLVSLAEARDKALQQRRLAREGGDPLEVKRRAAAIPTFKAAAETVYKLQQPSWSNEKHAKQWLSTLKTFAFESIGEMRVDAIASGDVMRVLEPIWNARPETARRVKQRIGTVMKWAMAKGWRTDNPAEAVSKGLTRHDRSKVKHHEALPYGAVGAAIRKVQSSEAGAITKLAFEFLVLTATRSGETRLARWNEFDLAKAEWVIPASRMKAKKPHRVPLSPRCLQILKEASAHKQPDSDLAFPGTKAGKPISDMTLSKLMKELAIPAVPHGFRSSFRDWAGEQTTFPREVIEFALAHVIKDKAEAAYARSDLYERRRGLMEEWTNYLRN